MNPTQDDPALESLPEARVETRRRFSIIWVIPLVAAVIGGILAYQAIMRRGPTVTIVLKSAEGLEAGKTRIKYKDVELGRVESISLSPDLSQVLVKASLSRDAQPHLNANTRFWVVRARIAAGEVYGLGTLFSGAYIAMDPGAEGAPRREFVGLDRPPVVTADFPGRRFRLRAERLGALDIGAPVYYRQIKVGQVDSYDLDPDGRAVTIGVFIEAPYHQYVYRNTRFWNAGGVDVHLDADGLQLNTPSFVSMMIGGIAFGNPADLEPGAPAEDGEMFPVYNSFAQSRQKTYAIKDRYLLYFENSIRGLQVGAPVEFGGIRIGRVLDVSLAFDAESALFRLPVLIEIEPERFAGGEGVWNRAKRRATMDQLVAKGFRAQLKTASFITGNLVVDFAIFPKAAGSRIVWEGDYPVLPTVSGSLQELTGSVIRLVERLNSLPIEGIGAKVQAAIENLDATLERAKISIDGLATDQISAETQAALRRFSETLDQTRNLVSRLDADVAGRAGAALDQARQTLASMEAGIGRDAVLTREARRAATELADAARSLRALADYLARHPEALIYGKDDKRR
jgi:paraquat-inducible protein B